MTNPEHLARWLPPVGTQMRFLRVGLEPGKSSFFVIEGQHGTMHARADYLEIEPPRRIVYTQQFVDEREQPTSAPGVECFPASLRTTVLLTEEGPDRTRVTVTSEPPRETTAEALDGFVRERSGMTLGWTGSFDKLEALLEAQVEARPRAREPR